MKKIPVLHPFLFAIYTVFGVYAQNPQELPVVWILRPLLILLGVTTLLFLLVSRWTEDRQYAGVITTLCLAWFFFGHIRNALDSITSTRITINQELLLLFVWSILLIVLGSKRVWRKIKLPELVTNFLNITFWVVILLPTYFVAVFTLQTIRQASILRSREEIKTEVVLSSTVTSRPDIYVIILDAYGRDDYLNDIFHYDNSNFTDFLRESGFYVAEQSSPNYPQTQLSLAGLLNSTYLDQWAKGLEQFNSRTPLTRLIDQSEARRLLEELGYKFVNIPNSTLISNVGDSDVYLPMTKINLNQFEQLILSTTLLDSFAQKWNLDLPIPGYANQRRTIQYQLDTLKTVPLLPGPKFVFVHILAPHPPFVFDEQGNPVQADAPYTLGDGGGYPGTREEYMHGYSQEIKYINKQLTQVVTSILEDSKEQPIIVIQGDHGPGSRFSMLKLEDVSCLWERFSILNAYYFPDQKYELLYPNITPVNSFRVIFNTYFGSELPLLEDKNFYASYATPYRMIEITDRITNSCP